MSNGEERQMILRMVEEGKISAEEGARLLAALNSADAGSDGPARTPAIGGGTRFLRVRVTDLVTGKEKVRVNIPAGLISFGLRYVPDIEGVDLQAIKAAIESGYSGQIVDVFDEEDGNHVEVYIE